MFRYFFLILIAGCFSCNKEGDFQSGDSYFEIHATWFYTPDQISKYIIKIDDELIADTFAYKSPDIKAYIQQRFHGPSAGKKRLQLILADKDSTVLDTMIQVNGKRILQFLSLDVADRPQLLSDGPASDESDPSDRNKVKFRLYYSEPMLPDSVKLVFYSCNGTVRPFKYDPLPVDSMVVHRRIFTPYKEMFATPYGRSSAFLYKLYDQTNGELIQDIVFRSPSVLATALGFCETLSLTRDQSGNLTNKLITSVFAFGHPGSTAPKLDKFSDTRLFMTPW